MLEQPLPLSSALLPSARSLGFLMGYTGWPKKLHISICLMFNWYSFVKSQPNFCNFWQTYTWIGSQQNNACTVHSTYCVFLHYLVKIMLSVFGAVSRWNLLMNYVGKQLNSVNHTKLYWSVYKQCLICTDERDRPVCRVISHGLKWLCVCLPDYRSARLRSRSFRCFEQILDVRCPASSPLYRPSQFSW